MDLIKQIAKNLKDVHFGENWTESNLRDVLSGLTWEEATQKVQHIHSIAALTYHMTYFVRMLMDVLEGRPLTGNDAKSFDVPHIGSQADWDNMLDTIWKNAHRTVYLLEQLPETKLTETFIDKKYGSYFNNIMGTLEHMHYHLGQIVIIKKIILK